MEEKKSLHQKLNGRIIKILLGSTLIIAIIIAMLLGSYRYYRDHVIETEQNDMLNLVTAVSRKLELYFESKDRYIREIMKEAQFKEDFVSLLNNDDEGIRLIGIMYRTNEEEINSIEITDKNGNLLTSYGETHGNTYYISEDMKLAVETKNPVYYVQSRGRKSINIIQPVNIDESKEPEGFIRVRISADYIYENYIEAYKSNETGYISVKDSSGNLFLHPSNQFIGSDVVDVRKMQYPDYDWSELEEIVRRQKNKETGVDTYHSIWPEDSTRVKKISSYTPSNIGDDFLIINLSLDYQETIASVDGLRDATIMISLMLIFVMGLAISYLYYIEVKKNRLILESIYLNEINQKNAQLMHQSRYAAMGEMLATIAHQLKQPLNALKISNYNIEDYYNEGEDDKEYLKSLIESNFRFIDKMAKTIDDFRNFFKPEDKGGSFTLNEAVQFSIDLNVTRINFMEVDIKIDIDENLEITGESNIFSQVILNLLNNSLDAFKEKDYIEDKSIYISAIETEKEIKLFFRDNAGGIEEKVIKRLFEPYITTKGEQGTGLGLYITRNILREKFNSEIYIHSEKEMTSCVIIIKK